MNIFSLIITKSITVPMTMEKKRNERHEGSCFDSREFFSKIVEFI